MGVRARALAPLTAAYLNSCRPLCHDVLDLHLVALDVASGKVLWQRKLAPLPGDIVLYMAHGQKKLVVTVSSDKNFYVYTFSDADG